MSHVAGSYGYSFGIDSDSDSNRTSLSHLLAIRFEKDQYASNDSVGVGRDMDSGGVDSNGGIGG